MGGTSRTSKCQTNRSDSG